jgi:hypothetical protein
MQPLNDLEKGMLRQWLRKPLLRLITLLKAVEVFTDTEVDMAKLLTPFGVAIRCPGEEDEPPVAELLAAARHFRDRLRPEVLAGLT